MAKIDTAKIDDFLHRKMSRKEFLALMGSILVTFIGLPAIIGALSSRKTDSFEKQPGDGFGSGIYR